MAAKKTAVDHGSHERRRARRLECALKKSVPAQWARGIEALARHEPGAPFWMRGTAWIERLEAFRVQHGGAVVWHMGDEEICQRAQAIAASVAELLTLWPEKLDDAARLDLVLSVCVAVGVDAPVAVTGAGAVARGQCPVWWRRVLRKKVARLVEHGAIRLGLVNRHGGGYASNDAVQRRRQQNARNEAMLAKTLIRNEAGQVYTLQELSALSVSNRDVRRGELMTRIRGCEEYADQSGHAGAFFTLTCPSKFHAMLAPKSASARAVKNKKYAGATPREAQAWLRQVWARTRSELARRGVEMYGFRVAEPHHDGCPHWHALLWFVTPAQAAQAEEVVRRHWLAEDGAEPGAQENRVNVKRMESGGAAGYIAKYIAKNVGGAVDVGLHMDGTGGAQADAFTVETGAVQGFHRVDAWAATWGIRQFQPIGQPPVTVWRALRRVTHEQAEQARIDGDAEGWKAWGAVHRSGNELACWRRYMQAMGGVCLKRGQWTMCAAKRRGEQVNQYGETVARVVVVGVEMRSGRWLVSKRQAWVRVAEGAQAPEVRASMARPWTGFNNCTARITHGLRRAFMGRGAHEPTDWNGAEVQIGPDDFCGNVGCLS